MTKISLGPNEISALRKKAGNYRKDEDAFTYWFHSEWYAILGDNIFTIAYPVGWLQDGDKKYATRYHPADGLYLTYEECTDFKIL